MVGGYSLWCSFLKSTGIWITRLRPDSTWAGGLSKVGVGYISIYARLRKQCYICNNNNNK
jgi:hypothetical protein